MDMSLMNKVLIQEISALWLILYLFQIDYELFAVYIIIMPYLQCRMMNNVMVMTKLHH